jgi:hypothetical protein
MGCDAGQDNEKPVHRVWIDEFLLAARQVTNAEYGRFLGDTASLSPLPPFWSDPRFNHPEQPVVGVSWHEAIRYCEWLSASTGGVTTGRNFRLPTEAEWERAARGGREARTISVGRCASAVAARLRRALRRLLEDGPRARRPRRTERIRSLQHVRQRARVVQRLVRARVLCSRPSAIHAALKRVTGALPAGDRGVTTSRCRAARPAPAFLRSSSTRTTGSAWLATYNCRSQVRCQIAEVRTS